MPTVFFFDFETKNDQVERIIPYYCVVQKVCKKFEKSADGQVKNVSCCNQHQFVFEGENLIDEFAEFLFGLHTMGYDLTPFLFCDSCLKENQYKILSWLCPEIKLWCWNIKWLWLLIVFVKQLWQIFPNVLQLKTFKKVITPICLQISNMLEKLLIGIYFIYPVWMKKQERNLTNGTKVGMAKPTCFVNNFITIVRWTLQFWENVQLNFQNWFLRCWEFIHCMTIASLVFKTFWCRFKKEKLIGILPALGYWNRVNQSMIALKFSLKIYTAEILDIKWRWEASSKFGDVMSSFRNRQKHMNKV